MKKWYAIYTKPRFEKKVHERFQNKGIESFLPLQETIKQWSDRKKKIAEPIFKNYIFVHIEYAKDYSKVLTTTGVFGFVKASPEIEAIRDEEIVLLKNLYENGHAFEINQNAYKRGKEVKINYGSLKNIKGKIVSILPKKIIIELDILEQNYTLIIPSHYVEVID